MADYINPRNFRMLDKPNAAGKWEYYFAYTTPQGQTRGKTVSTKEKDLAVAQQVMQAAIASMSEEAVVAKAGDKVTVKMVLAHYVRELEAEVRGRGERAANNVLAFDRLHGHLPVSAVTKAVITQYRQERRQTPTRNTKGKAQVRYITDNTVARELQAVQAAFVRGHKDGIAPLPPVGASLSKPKTTIAPVEALTFDQSEALWTWLEKQTDVAPRLKLAVLIALDTGHRRGAVLDLTWGRLMWNCGTDKAGNPVHRINFHNPDVDETYKRRSIVPMSARLEVHLRAALAEAQVEYAAYVARVRNGVPLPFDDGRVVGMSANAFRLAYDRLRGRLNRDPVMGKLMDWRKFNIHKARHTFVTNGLRRGIPLAKMAGAIADNPVTAAKRYAKWAQSDFDDLFA